MVFEKVCVQLNWKLGSITLSGLKKPRPLAGRPGPNWSVVFCQLNWAKRRSLLEAFQSKRSESSLPLNRLSFDCCWKSEIESYMNVLVRAPKLPAWSAGAAEQAPNVSAAVTPMILAMFCAWIAPVGSPGNPAYVS